MAEQTGVFGGSEAWHVQTQVVAKVRKMFGMTRVPVSFAFMSREVLNVAEVLRNNRCLETTR